MRDEGCRRWDEKPPYYRKVSAQGNVNAKIILGDRFVVCVGSWMCARTGFEGCASMYPVGRRRFAAVLLRRGIWRFQAAGRGSVRRRQVGARCKIWRQWPVASRSSSGLAEKHDYARAASDAARLWTVPIDIGKRSGLAHDSGRFGARIQGE